MGDKTEKTNSPKQGSSLLQRLKVDVRSQLAPPAHFPCPPDITLQQPACNQIGVFFTFTILTSAVCLASACVLVM